MSDLSLLNNGDDGDGKGADTRNNDCDGEDDSLHFSGAVMPHVPCTSYLVLLIILEVDKNIISVRVNRVNSSHSGYGRCLLWLGKSSKSLLD